MAQQYVTGPAAIWVGLGQSGQPAFLGYCERSPRIRKNRYYKDVWNSLAGTSVPIDRLYQGQDALVMATFTRWNEPVQQAVATLPPNKNTIFDGISLPGDIGTAMIAEGMAYTLWVQFPYFAKPSYGQSAAPMVAGYRFPAVMLEGPDDLDNLNTEAMKTSLIWYCGRTVLTGLPSSGGLPAGGVAFGCYDHDMSALPLFPPN